MAFLFSPAALLQSFLLVLYVDACSVQKRDARDFLPRTRSDRVVFQDMCNKGQKRDRTLWGSIKNIDYSFVCHK